MIHDYFRFFQSISELLFSFTDFPLVYRLELLYHLFQNIASQSAIIQRTRKGLRRRYPHTSRDSVPWTTRYLILKKSHEIVDWSHTDERYLPERYETFPNHRLMPAAMLETRVLIFSQGVGDLLSPSTKRSFSS